MVLPCDNSIINSLCPAHYGLLAPHLKRVALPRGELFEASGERIVTVCFPETAVLSLTAISESNAALDVALLGFEGMSGIGLILGNNLAIYSKVVRIAGTGLLMPAEAFVAVLERAPDLRMQLLGYVEALRYQISTTVAAAATARLETRLCRTVLMLHDRTRGEPIRITHDDLASVLGATRPAITAACIELQDAGLIRCKRARIEVPDRNALRGRCGHLYGDAEAHYARLTGI